MSAGDVQRGLEACMKTSYILVDAKAAPEVLFKTVEAKRLLAGRKHKTINEVLEEVQISRSAFYKYRDHVFSYRDAGYDKMLTLSFVLEDQPGVLSEVLTVLSKAQVNVLTINQNIPINGVAHVTMSISIDALTSDVGTLLSELESTRGVNRAEVLAMK